MLTSEKRVCILAIAALPKDGKRMDGTGKKWIKDMETYRILIVEDDENIAKYIQTCLGMGRYQSEICHSGQAAVQAVNGHHFDLMLLDVMLPGMDGFEVQERI